MAACLFVYHGKSSYIIAQRLHFYFLFLCFSFYFVFRIICLIFRVTPIVKSKHSTKSFSGQFRCQSQTHTDYGIWSEQLKSCLDFGSQVPSTTRVCVQHICCSGNTKAILAWIPGYQNEFTLTISQRNPPECWSCPSYASICTCSISSLVWYHRNKDKEVKVLIHYWKFQLFWHFSINEQIGNNNSLINNNSILSVSDSVGLYASVNGHTVVM